MADGDERVVDRRAASRMNDDEPKAQDTTDAQGERAAEAEKAAETAGEGQPGEPQTEMTLEQQLAEALEKADSYYKNWQRSAADFANYKRRTEQEKAETAKFASAALVINLLPVYDDLERAVSTVDSHLAGLNWVQGVINIQRKFKNMLEAMGVTEIEAEGAQFDPSAHEAVARQAGPEGQVIHVVQKGYRLGDRVVRPAMVIVGDGS